MKTVRPSVKILACTPRMEKLIEFAGRQCYVSAMSKTKEGNTDFIKKLIASGHESVLEHGVITVQFICDRGVSHELVRHRHISVSQESTRYCNYTKSRFSNHLTFISPDTAFAYGMSKPEDRKKIALWNDSIMWAEEIYKDLIVQGASPQEARSVLPNSLKTSLVVTANVREWRHIIKIRTHPTAHPQMREVMDILNKKFVKRWPVLFEDLTVGG